MWWKFCLYSIYEQYSHTKMNDFTYIMTYKDLGRFSMVHEGMGVTCTSTNVYRRVEQLDMNSGLTELIVFCFSFSTTCFSEGSCLIESCTSVVTLSTPYVIENHCSKPQSISLFSMILCISSIWTQFSMRRVFLHLLCNLLTAVDFSQ